ncbi:MAG: hypothetical protein HKN71_03855, partial [Gemmatimonadetes bacterium]|nr:hypothetical protein [Gemmatimonadota bacterium]
MTSTEIAATLGRGLQLVGLTAAVGGALAGAWSGATPDSLAATGSRWRRSAPLLLLGALAVLFGAQVVAFRDPFEALVPQIQGLLTRTDWGRVFSVQVALALAMIVPACRRRTGLYGLLAAASCASLAFMGHSWGVAEGRLLTIGAEIVHAVAAAVWL